MLPVLDIASIGASSLRSMITDRERLPQRAWTTEFTFRLAKKLLQDSLHHDYHWLRTRLDLLAMQGPALMKVDSHFLDLAGVRCLRCQPKRSGNAESRAPIVYFHGGGYVVGSVQAYRYTLASISLICNRPVIGVDYRRVPEFPVPAPQKDCLSVVRALLASNPQGLILMGDSAGAALSVSTALSLDVGERGQIAACVLMSPWVAPFSPDTLDLGKEHSDILDASILNRWAAELKVKAGELDERLQLCHANLEGLPPTYIQAAGAEIMLPQIEAFSERLEHAGVQHLYEVFPGQFHVFQTLLPLVSEAELALQKIGDYLEKV